MPFVTLLVGVYLTYVMKEERILPGQRKTFNWELCKFQLKLMSIIMMNLEGKEQRGL